MVNYENIATIQNKAANEKQMNYTKITSGTRHQTAIFTVILSLLSTHP